MKNYQIKTLNKAYKKHFKALSKNIFKTKDTGITIFVDNLRYLRDVLVLESENNNNISKNRLATIITAIAEYDAYASCSSEENNSQKTFHWNNFCELLKQNAEEWLKE